MSDRRTATRRGFLKGLAAALTGAAAASPAAALAAPGERRAANAVRVALVIPRTTLDTGIGERFASGLETGLEGGTDARDGGPGGGRMVLAARLEIVRAGATPATTLAAVQKMAGRGGVDVVVAVAQPTAVTDLARVAEPSRLPVVIADAGANVPRAHERSPFVVQQTLGLWQSAWASGAWAARAGAASAAVVGSLHDIGYDLPFAFEAGFRAAGGRRVSIVCTDTPQAPHRHGVAGAAARVSEGEPEAVYLLGSPALAAAFLAEYSGPARIVASPLAFDEALARATGADPSPARADGVTSIATWGASASAGGSPSADRLPDAFTLLGYRTGTRIAAAAEAAASTGGTLLGALAAVWPGPVPQRPGGAAGAGGPPIPSPIAAALTEALPALYVRRAAVDGDRLVHRVVEQIAPDPRDMASLASLVHSPRTGWLQPYLVV